MPTIIRSISGRKRDADSTPNMISNMNSSYSNRFVSSVAFTAAGKCRKMGYQVNDELTFPDPNKVASQTNSLSQEKSLCGYLFRKLIHSGLSLWKKRWCVLTSTSMYLYKNREDTMCCEHIDIVGRKVSHMKGVLKYQFVLTSCSSMDHAVILRAGSEEEYLMWLAALGEDIHESSSRVTLPKETCRMCVRHIHMNSKILHIILVRHGHYVNANSKDVADENQVLSEMGKQQAHLTGNHIHHMLSSMKHITMTLPHSDLRRASETAMIIGQRVGCEISEPCALLREGWPGRPWPVRSCMESHEEHGTLPDDVQNEENRRLKAAFQLYFAQYIEEPHNAYRVIVCHANIIRYFICQTLGIDSVGVWGKMEINHCSLTRIDVYEDGMMKLMAMNETGHLPQTLTTSSEDHL